MIRIQNTGSTFLKILNKNKPGTCIGCSSNFFLFRALNNIREALHKRSMALSVTSIGAISADNMRFLGMYSDYSPVFFIPPKF